MTFKVTIEGEASDVKNFLLGFAGKEKDVDVQILVDNIPVGEFVKPNVLVRESQVEVDRRKVGLSSPPFGDPSRLMTIFDFILHVGIRSYHPVRNRTWGYDCAKKCRRQGIPYGFKTGECGVNKYPFHVIREMYPY